MQQHWQLEEVLPHKPPMILIDDIVDIEQEGLAARVRIGEDSRFYESLRGVPVWVGLEYMAQTVAAHVGTLALMQGEAVRIGLLLGTRRYETTTKYFALGQLLHVQVRRVLDEGGLGQYRCQITTGEDQMMAKANVNAFMPKDIADYIPKQGAGR